MSHNRSAVSIKVLQYAAMYGDAESVQRFINESPDNPITHAALLAAYSHAKAGKHTVIVRMLEKTSAVTYHLALAELSSKPSLYQTNHNSLWPKPQPEKAWHSRTDLGQRFKAKL